MSGPRELGDLPSADTGYRLQREPDLLRAPNVSFVSRERALQDGAAGFFTRRRLPSTSSL